MLEIYNFVLKLLFRIKLDWTNSRKLNYCLIIYFLNIWLKSSKFESTDYI